jgi:hypothetical protein
MSSVAAAKAAQASKGVIGVHKVSSPSYLHPRSHLPSPHSEHDKLPSTAPKSISLTSRTTEIHRPIHRHLGAPPPPPGHRPLAQQRRALESPIPQPASRLQRPICLHGPGDDPGGRYRREPLLRARRAARVSTVVGRQAGRCGGLIDGGEQGCSEARADRGSWGEESGGCERAGREGGGDVFQGDEGCEERAWEGWAPPVAEWVGHEGGEAQV